MSGTYKKAFTKGKELFAKGKESYAKNKPKYEQGKAKYLELKNRKNEPQGSGETAKPQANFFEENKTILLIGAGALVLFFVMRNK